MRINGDIYIEYTSVILILIYINIMKKAKWNDATVLEAVEKFRSENGDYPRQHDFQFTDYLPDPETIRRLYGGIPMFRKKFGFGIEDYTKGQVRSELNKTLNDRAKSHEDKMQNILVKYFGEICVHKEREFSYRNRVDFQVYHAEGIFGVDTFYPKNRIGLINNFNLKYGKYKNFSLGPVYLVCMNSELSQEILNIYMNLRKVPAEEKIKLLTEEDFIKEIKLFNPRTSI